MKIKKSNLLPAAIALLLALYYTFPFLLKLSYWGVRDWDLFLAVLGAPVETIKHYGQFPFWNPWMGGGNILFHHPEVGIFSPFFLLHLIFGIVVGLKLQVLVCYFLGFYGTQKLAGRLGMSLPAAALTAVAYFGSVHFALHFAEGHIPFTSFCFLPWFLFFLLYHHSRLKNILLAAVVLALMILGHGAAIPLLYTLTFSGLLLFIMAVEKQRLRPLIDLAWSVIIALALSAVKFIPMVLYLTNNRWAGAPDEAIPVSALGSIFFGWEHSLFAQNFEGQLWAWHEYGFYLSPFLILFVIAALRGEFKKHRVYLILAGFFLLLGLGNFGSLSPWALFSNLPGFSSARCTGRSFQMVTLAVALMGGFGFDYLRNHWSKKPASWLYTLYAGLGIVIISNLVLVWPIMNSGFNRVAPAVNRATVFHQVIDKQPKAFENMLTNRGALISPWLSAYHPSRALVDETNVVHEEYFLSGTAVVSRRYYTPNKIEYRLQAQTKGQIVIGMGYDAGWSLADGQPLFKSNNLLAWQFEAGEHNYILTYRPLGLPAGSIISILALIGWLVLWRRRPANP